MHAVRMLKHQAQLEKEESGSDVIQIFCERSYLVIIQSRSSNVICVGLQVFSKLFKCLGLGIRCF